MNNIIQLNLINKKFYSQVASDFSESRNYFWTGWEELLPIISRLAINHLSLIILDLACGNGRFLEFLISNYQFPNKFSYLGIDGSQELLNIAQNKFKKQKQIKFEKLDIVENLLNNDLKLEIRNLKFNFIVCFGFLHHVPDFVLRQQLLQNLADLLTKDGILVVSTWQFLENPRLKARIVKDLGNNDYILDWRRGKEARRYCHLISDEEMTSLIGNKFLVIKKFRADKYNDYWVLQKIN